MMIPEVKTAIVIESQSCRSRANEKSNQRNQPGWFSRYGGGVFFLVIMIGITVALAKALHWL